MGDLQYVQRYSWNAERQLTFLYHREGWYMACYWNVVWYYSKVGGNGRDHFGMRLLNFLLTFLFSPDDLTEVYVSYSTII